MNPDQTINLNHNAAQCIKTSTRFGYDIYFNICNGTQTTIIWGWMDYVLAVFLVCLMIAVAGAALAGLAGFIRWLIWGEEL